MVTPSIFKGLRIKNFSEIFEKKKTIELKMLKNLLSYG